MRELWDVSIDIREQYEGMSKQFSFAMLYVRNCKYVRCTCYDEAHDSANPTCQKCMGSGFFASVEKVDVIEAARFGGVADNKMLLSELGMLNSGESLYFMRHHVCPKNKDFLLKVAFDTKGRPVRLEKVLEIISTHDQRGTHGKEEFYKVTVKERVDKEPTFERLVQTLPIRARNVLAKGEEYIWPYKIFQT